MNNFCKSVFSLIILASIPCFGMIRVMRDETGFKVFDGQHERQVNNYDVHPFLRKLTPEQVQKFEEVKNELKTVLHFTLL